MAIAIFCCEINGAVCERRSLQGDRVIEQSAPWTSVRAGGSTSSEVETRALTETGTSAVETATVLPF
jgi:hypothetical protein